MYAQTERGTVVDWADHIIIMIYAIAGALYSVYLAAVGVYGVFTNVDLMTSKPSGAVLGALLLSLLLVVVGVVLANTATRAFVRMLREGPNPDPKVLPKPKAGFFTDLMDRLAPELGDPARAAARRDNPTAKQAQRRVRDEQRAELANQLREQLAQRRNSKGASNSKSNNKKKR
jgi:hypothetical protein